VTAFPVLFALPAHAELTQVRVQHLETLALQQVSCIQTNDMGPRRWSVTHDTHTPGGAIILPFVVFVDHSKLVGAAGSIRCTILQC
jgi:hypothetical protein